MTRQINNPVLRRRLVRIARIIDRVKRWERLAFLDDAEADQILTEYEEAEACADDMDASMDDGSYPAGPRNDKNKSRYQLSPGHGQHFSDLLRNTAETRAIQRIANILTLADEMKSRTPFRDNWELLEEKRKKEKQKQDEEWERAAAEWEDSLPEGPEDQEEEDYLRSLQDRAELESLRKKQKGWPFPSSENDPLGITNKKNVGDITKISEPIEAQLLAEKLISIVEEKRDAGMKSIEWEEAAKFFQSKVEKNLWHIFDEMHPPV